AVPTQIVMSGDDGGQSGMARDDLRRPIQRRVRRVILQADVQESAFTCREHLRAVRATVMRIDIPRSAGEERGRAGKSRLEAGETTEMANACLLLFGTRWMSRIRP